MLHSSLAYMQLNQTSPTVKRLIIKSFRRLNFQSTLSIPIRLFQFTKIDQSTYIFFQPISAIVRSKICVVLEEIF